MPDVVNRARPSVGWASALYDRTALEMSAHLTRCYSTSFTLGIRTLAPALRSPVYAIYGFVRLADEIVDTFHAHDKAALLADFATQTHAAIADSLSLNPVLHAFQLVVNRFGIEPELIDAFLHSMALDLDEGRAYDQELYERYIYGSAEVVGLMCLRVFCEGDAAQYARLREPARRLGAAFQKVNFLRDLRSDYAERGRTYFPAVDFTRFDDDAKQAIEADIRADFQAGLVGIQNLPRTARLGVFLAYTYYQRLFARICRVPAARVQCERIRVPDATKLTLLAASWVRFRLGLGV
ncbi:MAG: phytoene/squalene synthase family protein [Hymenobacteraceae bacterium]|nr:phytoene/squalene synthase family protein [Hymenobacteraceae bacterium]